MSQNNNEFERNLASSLQFLFSKADAVKPDGLQKGRTSAKLTDLTNIFPYRLVGSDFVNFARSSLTKTDNFGVLLIRPDDTVSEESSTDSEKQSSPLVDIALTINALCKISDALWGQLNDDLFTCFFANKGTFACLGQARTIQSDLAKIRTTTVCIGVAVYPTLTYTKEQILENAYKALNHALRIGPSSIVAFDAVSLNISGDQFYQNGDIPSAIEELQCALLMDASDINVHNSLGVCYGVMGEYEKALRYFETVIRLNDQDTMGWYNCGLIALITDGDKNKALDYFYKAEALAPNIFETTFQIGKLQAEQGNWEKGRVYLEKAQKINPDAGIIYPHLGKCYLAAGMTEEAIGAYKKAIKHNPNDAASLSALGSLYDMQSINPEIARVYCCQSVEIAPQNGLFRYRLGQLHFRTEEFDLALEQFRKAHSLGIDSIDYIQKCKVVKTGAIQKSNTD
ncbi:tetratricopeptide repeat protein [Desulfococcaceae bacterium HSG9]|nr:tetratricopeptide repeat protein [Desulfococcaceae bacterium HSG9]